MVRQNGEDFSFARQLPSPNDERLQKIFKHLRNQYRSIPQRLRGARPDFAEFLERVLGYDRKKSG